MTVKRKPRSPDARFGESFSFGDIVKWTNASRSNLIHWTNVGIVKADVEDTSGPGFPRRFSPLNFVEVQLAWHLNRLKIPVSTIGMAVGQFRDFHLLNRALFESGQTDGVQLTEGQRIVALAEYAAAMTRRDVRMRAEDPLPPSHYRQVINQDHLFSPENQKLMLHHARTWESFLDSNEFREQHFYGLFVLEGDVPDDDYATIGDEPLNLSEMVRYAAIVLNLAPVIEYTRAVCGRRLR